MNLTIAKKYLLSIFISSTIHIEPVYAQSESFHPLDENKIIFGGHHSSPPFEWQDGQLKKGFTIDLQDKIAEIGGVTTDHKLGEWSDMIQALTSGQIDVLAMYISEERQDKFLFSSPFYFVEHAIFASSSDKGPVSLNMLSGQRVAVEASYYAEDELIANHPNVNIVSKTSTLSALKAIETGEAKYALLTIPSASFFIDEDKLNLSQVSSPFWPRGYGFAVKKDRPELAEWIENNLSMILTSDMYHAIYQSWRDELEPQRLTNTDIFKKALVFVSPLFLLIVFGYIWSASLKRQVDIKTKEVSHQLNLKQLAESKLKYRSRHDEFTGLPHHFHAFNLANQMFQKEKVQDSVKDVIVFKLDESEIRTRIFGYAIEEKFTKAFAERLKQSGFDICAYLGRGYFTVITSPNRFKAMVDKFSEKIYIHDLAFHPRILCGIATWPADGDNAEDLGRKAEAALAFCCENKKNWYSHYTEYMEPDKYDLQILSEFRNYATANMFVVLQPQIDLETGSIVGAEALIRWTCKELGEVPPWKFIPLLESAGVVSKVTRFMIDEVIKISVRLSENNASLPLSINVSAQDFERVELPRLFQESLESHGALAKNIKLELTETSIAENPMHVKDILIELSEMGIHTSIDDFGTGYSSLSYLSSFPIKEIKIDREFIQDLPSNEKNRSIVRSTIAMAHGLGISVIAEGAEDQETIEILKAEGCNRVQGYVISKPLTEQIFQEFITQKYAEYLNMLSTRDLNHSLK